MTPLRKLFPEDPEIQGVLNERQHNRLWKGIQFLQDSLKNISLTPGPQGEQGIEGPIGPKGPQGEPGTDGKDGRDGRVGPEGPAGPKGDKGERGEKGDKGDPGEDGKPIEIDKVIEKLKKEQLLEPKDIKGMPLNMSDLRWHGSGGKVNSVVAGTNISVDSTDPANPIVSSTASPVSPGGVDTNIQFNDAGTFGGDSRFLWDKNTGIFTNTGDTQLQTLTTNGTLSALSNLTVNNGQFSVDVSNGIINLNSADVWLYNTSNAHHVKLDASSITADRTATFQNSSGTLAYLSDIPSTSGFVVGPASAVNNHVVFFDGTTGKLIKDSGLTLSGTNTGDITVVDTSSIDFTLTGQSLTASVLPAGVDHNSLANLTTGDPHTQYALLVGRSGGQSLSGGTAANDDLTLQGTTNSTRTTSYVNIQPNGGNVGIGTSTPTSILQVINGSADMRFSSGFGGITPSLLTINTNTGGKAAGLAAGSNFAFFSFDDAGYFAIETEPHANFSGNTIGAGTILMRMENGGSTAFASGVSVGMGIPFTPPVNGMRIGSNVWIGAHTDQFGLDMLNVNVTTDINLGVRAKNSALQLYSHNDADSTSPLMQIDTSELQLNRNTGGNIALFGPGSYGSGVGVLFIANGTAPSGTPSGGGILYVESGVLKFKGSSGTVTTIAAA